MMRSDHQFDHPFDAPDVTASVMRRLGFEEASPREVRKARRLTRLRRASSATCLLLLVGLLGLLQQQGQPEQRGGWKASAPGVQQGHDSGLAGLVSPFLGLQNALGIESAASLNADEALVEPASFHGPLPTEISEPLFQIEQSAFLPFLNS